MNRGFTLIELAIVLVVIGLLAGGIMAGKDLIRGSELQSVLTDANRFKTAVTIFESRYNAMPGDMPNATKYWPNATYGTVNGNGNGVIDYNNGVANTEEYYAWQHLALAGLIQGTYTGATNSIPQSKLNNGYYRMSYQKGILLAGSYTGVYGRYGHMISINMMNTGSGIANFSILSAKDVTSLDAKADDGLAPTGEIMGFNQQGIAGCVSNDYTVVGGPWTYVSSSDNVKCKIFFMLPE